MPDLFPHLVTDRGLSLGRSIPDPARTEAELKRIILSAKENP